MNKMKYGMLVVIAAIFGFVWLAGSQSAKANPYAVTVKTNATSNALGTSTASYIGSGVATSTLQFAVENGQVIQLYLASYSTSTAPQIALNFEFSNDGSNWYPFVVVTPAAVAAVSSGATLPFTWGWSAATTTANETVFKTFTTMTDFAGRYARLKYSGNVSSKLHVTVAVKEEI